MITLSYRDGRPIYEQVKDSLRHLIVSGALPSNGKLPSVRELAASLAINPNTIQRAYRELEMEGYIYSIPGKGSFASPGQENAQRCHALLAQFDEIAAELKWMGVSTQELIKRIGG